MPTVFVATRKKVVKSNWNSLQILAKSQYSLGVRKVLSEHDERTTMTRQPFYHFASATVAILFVVNLACAGPDWEEICDAGSTPSGAQVVPVSGTVKSIRGTLGACPGLVGGPDFEDMYLIQIDQPGIFCAQTVTTSTSNFCCRDSISPVVDTNFNTQLWLFAADGSGLLGNDDQFPFIAPGLSLLPNASDDGSGIVITVPGLYYLAISGGPNRDPFSAGGQMFQQGSTFEVSGPDGVGGGPNPITAWNGAGVQGQYQIFLCGVKGVPSIPTVSEWSMIALAATIIIAGAVLTARKRRLIAAGAGAVHQS